MLILVNYVHDENRVRPQPLDFVPNYQEEAALFSLTNVDRRNMPALTETSTLTGWAEARALYLCMHPFAHDGWEGFFNRVPYTHIGENLARNYIDATSTNTALMKSLEHRTNILDPRYTNVGVASGSCMSSEYGTQSVSVELFGGYN